MKPLFSFPRNRRIDIAHALGAIRSALRFTPRCNQPSADGRVIQSFVQSRLIWLDGLIIILALLTVLTIPLKSQESQMTARELFYNAIDTSKGSSETPSTANSRIPHPASLDLPKGPADSWAIRYMVLKQLPGRQFQGVDVNRTVFQDGDAIRIRIETNRAICLCVLQKGSSGVWSLLFPLKGSANKDWVSPSQPFEIPPQPGRFLFDTRGGTEDIYLIGSLSYVDVTPLLAKLNGLSDPTDAEKTTHANTREQRAILQEVGRSSIGMASRELVFEEAEEATAGDLRDVVFYVSHIGREGMPQVVHFSLKHSGGTSK